MRDAERSFFADDFFLGLLTFVKLSVEIALDVKTLSCDDDCCVRVALGSEHADREGEEEWIEKDRAETVRRVLDKMHCSASPVANVAYKS